MHQSSLDAILAAQLHQDEISAQSTRVNQPTSSLVDVFDLTDLTAIAGLRSDLAKLNEVPESDRTTQLLVFQEQIREIQTHGRDGLNRSEIASKQSHLLARAPAPHPTFAHHIANTLRFSSGSILHTHIHTGPSTRLLDNAPYITYSELVYHPDVSAALVTSFGMSEPWLDNMIPAPIPLTIMFHPEEAHKNGTVRVFTRKDRVECKRVAPLMPRKPDLFQCFHPKLMVLKFRGETVGEVRGHNRNGGNRGGKGNHKNREGSASSPCINKDDDRVGHGGLKPFLRIVISSANLIPEHFSSVENVVWVQDFPLLPAPSSPAHNRHEFCQYLSSYLTLMGAPAEWPTLLHNYDYSRAKARLVASYPGDYFEKYRGDTYYQSNGDYGGSREKGRGASGANDEKKISVGSFKYLGLPRLKTLVAELRLRKCWVSRWSSETNSFEPTSVSFEYQTSSLGNITPKWLNSFCMLASGCNPPPEALPAFTEGIAVSEDGVGMQKEENGVKANATQKRKATKNGIRDGKDKEKTEQDLLKEFFFDGEEELEVLKTEKEEAQHHHHQPISITPLHIPTTPAKTRSTSSSTPNHPRFPLKIVFPTLAQFLSSLPDGGNALKEDHYFNENFPKYAMHKCVSRRDKLCAMHSKVLVGRVEERGARVGSAPKEGGEGANEEVKGKGKGKMKAECTNAAESNPHVTPTLSPRPCGYVVLGSHNLSLSAWGLLMNEPHSQANRRRRSNHHNRNSNGNRKRARRDRTSSSTDDSDSDTKTQEDDSETDDGTGIGISHGRYDRILRMFNAELSVFLEVEEGRVLVGCESEDEDEGEENENGTSSKRGPLVEKGIHRFRGRGKEEKGGYGACQGGSNGQSQKRMKNTYIPLEAVFLHESPPDPYAPTDEPWIAEKFYRRMREMLVECVGVCDAEGLVTDLEVIEGAIQEDGVAVSGSRVMGQGGEGKGERVVLEGGGLEEYVCRSTKAGSGLWRSEGLMVPDPWAKTGF
ncbi:hypothetical protein HK102_000980 [Quaeritorhiza haematococci]|nr:hypothetical protein HK102_000980 [Quaeritorhiza haematococci]